MRAMVRRCPPHRPRCPRPRSHDPAAPAVDLARPLPSARAALFLAAPVALALAAWAQAAAGAACEGAERIRLRTPVVLDAGQLAALRALPPLRVTAVSAPPLVRYDEPSARYSGVAPDVLCFISQRTGLRYEVLPARDVTVADKIRQVQDGRMDLLMPLSSLPERERLGLFTLPFYDSYYAAITLRGRRLELHSTADLARWRVGAVQGVAIIQALQASVPASQWHTYQQTVGEAGLFEALRRGDIDVALFNRDFFAEERFRHELFDLEAVHVLREFPRAYRFYLHRSPANDAVAAVFDRYLAVMDVSASLQYHEDGERRLIERYVHQRSQRTLLQAASAAIALLAVAAFLALRHYRRLLQRLGATTQHVMRQQEQLLLANRELEQLSQTDGLTRLANRRHFDHALAREHARWQRGGAPLSLLMVDLDHFKRVNDRYGHAVGDDYLRAVARTLAANAVRATDLAARYGGEEFACLLPDTEAHDAQQVAERIRMAVQDLALPNQDTPATRLTVSVGVATLAGGHHDGRALVVAADEQLYAAKHAGRNQVKTTILD